MSSNPMQNKTGITFARFRLVFLHFHDTYFFPCSRSKVIRASKVRRELGSP